MTIMLTEVPCFRNKDPQVRNTTLKRDTQVCLVQCL
jgi:hypothetical protein